MGAWELRPVLDGGKIVGTQGVLRQEVQPRGEQVTCARACVHVAF